MALSNVTLKDIAQAMGVTVTTVHRALHGKEGVSDETRSEVQRIAAEMGYRSNYMAAALKRGELRIAIAMPEPTGDSRYYYGNLWSGVRRFLDEVPEFNIVPIEYTYPLTYGANGAVLKDIYEKHGDRIDGLLTMAVDQGGSSYFIEKFADKKVPIVFVGSDMYRERRFCCVKTYDEMAGSLAAELLTAFREGKQGKKVMLVGHFGQLAMKDQYYNADGFERYLQQHAPQVEIVRVQGEDRRAVCREIEQILRSEPGIHAIYSSSARYTVHMAEIVEELDLVGKVKLIGNDCFDESVELLKRGVLSAIIDKKIPRQSYLAMRVLSDYLVKGSYPGASVEYVWPEVVLRSNVGKNTARR